MVYRYDGSFDGFLCCVFESYARHEVPEDIQPRDIEQASLFGGMDIETDLAHAARVFSSLSRKINPQAQEMVSRGFLSGEDGKEMAIYRFIRMGLKLGPRTVDMLGNPIVSRMHAIVRAIGREAHLTLEFLRFSEHRMPDGTYAGLAAIIEPKNLILPLLEEHFTGRFPEETFLIYDMAHGLALLYHPYEARLFPVDDLELPPVDETEMQYQRLWRQYYSTIGIESRRNERCRMGHMPKHFWKHMLEMDGEQFPTYGRLKANGGLCMPGAKPATSLPGNETATQSRLT